MIHVCNSASPSDTQLARTQQQITPFHTEKIRFGMGGSFQQAVRVVRFGIVASLARRSDSSENSYGVKSSRLLARRTCPLSIRTTDPTSCNALPGAHSNVLALTSHPLGHLLVSTCDSTVETRVCTNDQQVDKGE